MIPELFRRARVVFDEAADLPPGDRQAYLRRACGEDDALLKEVEALLSECESGPLESGVHATIDRQSSHRRIAGLNSAIAQSTTTARRGDSRDLRAEFPRSRCEAA